MSIKSVGLSTHIWNNNLRCIMMLALYPVLILGMFWGLAFVLGVVSVHMPSDDMNGLWILVEFSNRIFFDFWPMVVAGVGIWFLISWFSHTQMIRQMARSHPVSRQEEPELYNLLENLCISRGVPMPRLEIIETHARNAFASGIHKGNYAVTVTRGLMNSLSEEELEAVLAHELTHIQNNDVRLLIVTIIFTGLFGFLAQIAWRSLVRGTFYRMGNGRNKGGAIVLVLLVSLILGIGYFVSLFMRFALSRKREYMADAGAIEMTKNPDAMMRALMRIAGRDRMPAMSEDIAMMCIENHKSFLGMFATHPPIEKRIRAISEVTNTPIPDQASLPPIEKEQSFSQNTEGKRQNPWLTMDRRGKRG